jgi:hypothetical protein
MQASDYLMQGLAKSASARPDLLITANGELLSHLNLLVEHAFLDAAQALVPAFVDEQTVGLSTVGTVARWVFPVNALRVFEVKVLAGTTGVTLGTWPAGSLVSVVPWHDREYHTVRPCVVELGRALAPTGVTGVDHPTGGDLQLRYARRPAVMADLTSAIDTDWPAQHDEALILGVAMYAAAKDGRAEDLAMFTAMHDASYARYLGSVGTPVAVTRARSSRHRSDDAQRTR